MLIEVGAHRSLHGVDEVPDDAILVEAFDLAEQRLDIGEDRGLLRAVLFRRPQFGIEARTEQRNDARGDRGVSGKARPHIALGIGNADLAQIARQAAHQRDFTPGEAGGKHQSVIAVVFRFAAHHRGKAGIEPRLCRLDIGGAAIGPIKRDVVQPEAISEGDLIGALVDYREPHMLEHWNALRQRDRTATAPQFEACSARLRAGRAGKIDAERGFLGQGRDGRDIGDGIGGCKDVAIGRRKRAAICGEQGMGRGGLMGRRKRFAQTVRPGRDEPRHLGFKAGALRLRKVAVSAGNDEMHADHRSFRKERHK